MFSLEKSTNRSNHNSYAKYIYLKNTFFFRFIYMKFEMIQRLPSFDNFPVYRCFPDISNVICFVWIQGSSLVVFFHLSHEQSSSCSSILVCFVNTHDPVNSLLNREPKLLFTSCYFNDSVFSSCIDFMPFLRRVVCSLPMTSFIRDAQWRRQLLSYEKRY